MQHVSDELVEQNECLMVSNGLLGSKMWAQSWLDDEGPMGDSVRVHVCDLLHPSGSAHLMSREAAVALRDWLNEQLGE